MPNQSYQQLIKLSTVWQRTADRNQFLTSGSAGCGNAPATILQALQQPVLAAALELIEQPAQIHLQGLRWTLDQSPTCSVINWATKHQVALIAFDPLKYLAFNRFYHRPATIKMSPY